MSFGRPGGLGDTFKVSPPQRGSFPLDHDGECKAFMLSYMRCLKTHGSDSGQCRPQARAYLECRMDNGLMDRDDMTNLGLGDVVPSRPGDDTKPAPTQSNSAKADTSSGSGTSRPGGMDPSKMERI